MSDLKLFFFGPPRVEFDGKPVDLQRRKAVALLIYLAVSEQVHSRDALATLFWPDQTQQRARAYLRRDLAVLNTSLGGEWLDADRDNIELKRGPEFWLDVAEFRQLLAECQRHDHPAEAACPDCLARLSKAAALYQDDFLAGFTLRDSAEFDDWQFFEAESLRQDLATVLERLVRGYAAQGEYETTIPYARRWLDLDPLYEPAQRELMQLYDRSGQPAAALRQYEEYVNLLEEELGLPPEEDTTTLYEAIKAKRLLEPYIKKVEAQDRKRAAQQKSSAAEEAPPSPVPSPSPDPAASSEATAENAAEAAAPHPDLSAQTSFSPDREQSLAETKPSDLPPFVGREKEYDQLIAAVTQARGGQGQVVLISGEPGIGKSRLAQEGVRYAQSQGMNLLWQKCYQSEQAIPYQVLIDLVAQMLANWPADTFRDVPPTSLAELALMAPEILNSFPHLPTLPGGLAEARQARLFRALHQFIIAPAARGALILVIDDIQWADHVTLQFLHHLAHHIMTQPVLLVCTYRTEEVAIDEQLTASVQDLQREPHASLIQLARLSLQAANSLVESLPAAPHVAALGQWLHRETDGNPFFLMSILQSLREQGVLTAEADAGWQIDMHPLQSADSRLRLPEALRRSVLDRLRRVPQQPRRILDVAAVYGRRFDFATLQAVTGVNSIALLDVVEDLMIRQLLQEEGRTYDFSHDKIREVVYHDLSRMRQVLLHRQVAEALEAADPGRVGTLAEHFEKGEVWDKAIKYLAQAGERARQLFAMEEALSYYDRAIALAKQQPEVISQPMLLALYGQRGETRGLVGGQADEAVADLEYVLEAAREAGDQDRERILLIRIGQVYRYGDRYHDALKYLKAALDVARQSDDERCVADALYHLGATVWSQGYNDQALVYHQEAVDICERLALEDLVAVQAYHGLGEAFFLAGRAEEAIGLYEKSLELARQIQDKSYESENLGNMGMAMQVYGAADYERAKEVIQRAVKISQSANLEWHATQELGPLGLAYSLSGDYHQGLKYLNRSLGIAASIGARRFHSNLLDMQGMIWQELNLLDRAKAAHEQAVELAEQADAGWWLPRIRANLAIDRIRLGDLAEVEETLQTSLEQALKRRLEIHAVRCLEGLAELALAQGNPQAAIEYAERLQDLAEPGGMREIVAQARRWRGEALLASGEAMAGEAELKAALAMAEAIGRPRLEWDIHAGLVKVYRALDQTEMAGQHAARVKNIVDQIAHNLQDTALRTGLGMGFSAPRAADVEKRLITVESEVDKQGTRQEPKPRLTSPKQRFVQERLIASGGMGEVYRGWDVENGQQVAIKRLRPELITHSPQAVERLIREGEILRQLNHPNIVRILATVEIEGQPVIVMEYIPGGSLQARLEQESQLPLDQIFKLGLELADALARVHHLDIIHRDLKPANILLAEDGTPRLTDFGVAYLASQETRLTREGDILGTTLYMSPEAWRSEALDARSDIWSFGAILYEMLAGQPPFAAKQIVAIMRAILNDPVPDLYQFRPDAPPALVTLIEQMLVKERELRIDSMRQVAAALEVIRRSVR